MPDPLMDTLDEIDRKSGKLVTEGTSLHVLKIRAINLNSHLRYFKKFNNCYIWL